MPTKFDTAIERVLSHEGGYVKDPKDPGGETQWGISKRAYPLVNIRALTRDDAKAIYRRDFWGPIRGEELPLSLGFQALDFAVNSGIPTAIRKLQAALGVADDGHIGPITLAALNAAKPAPLLMRYLAARLDFMRRLSTWSTFGNGWAGRIAVDLQFAAQDL